jgi:hypothetical protein
MNGLRIFAALLLASLAALHAADVNQAGVPASRPNVIIILADDLGYECIGANGGRTPSNPGHSVGREPRG